MGLSLKVSSFTTHSIFSLPFGIKKGFNLRPSVYVHTHLNLRLEILALSCVQDRKKRKSVFRVQVIFYFSKYNIFLRIVLNVYHDCSPTYSTIIYMYPSGCATIRFLCIQFKSTMLCSEMQSVCRGFSITCLSSLGQWHQPPTLAFCVVHTQWL